MKQLEKFFDIETQYDKKHKLNTCNKKVPSEYLTSIEKGCSLERLEEMMHKKFDVFKYKTQITIHGLFPELSTNRVGGYVNLTQNKNKSIGVRYTAIDHEKKTRLYNLLSKISDWHITENSCQYYINKMEELPSDCKNNREKILEIVRKYEAEAKQIDKSLFVGNVSCYIARGLFRNYMCLDANICCFYEKDFYKLFENLSVMTWEEGQKKRKSANRMSLRLGGKKSVKNEKPKKQKKKRNERKL